ncbi:MAG: hypothetical protein EOP47_19160, partial [Sphingobacteriaceae bacterium]
MKRILLAAIIGLLLTGCQKEKLKPEKLATYRLVRALTKTPDGKLAEDYTYGYDDSNRVIKSKKVYGASRRIYSEYFYDDATGNLVKKIEQDQDNGITNVTTSIINYADGIPVSANIDRQSTISSIYVILFRVEEGKVVSARIDGSAITDSVVYENNNIVQRF